MAAVGVSNRLLSAPPSLQHCIQLSLDNRLSLVGKCATIGQNLDDIVVIIHSLMYVDHKSNLDMFDNVCVQLTSRGFNDTIIYRQGLQTEKKSTVNKSLKSETNYNSSSEAVLLS